MKESEPDIPDMENLLEDVEDEDDLSKIIATLLDPKNIHHLTDLTNNEILAFSTLATMGKKYKLQLLEHWLAQNLTLKVSKGRGGRKEFVKITQRMADPQPEPRRGSILDQFRR